MRSKISPRGRRNDVVVQRLNGELLIYDLKINKAYCLNDTATRIYDLCNGENSIDDIDKKLNLQLDRHVDEYLVPLVLEQLKKDNLLDDAQEFKTGLEGLSRREVIRKLGISSMIAIPVISSLIAPTAVAAASTCSCVNPGNCLTQTSCPSTTNCNPSGQCAP